MILSDLLKALSGNAGVNITLNNADGDSLITFNAGGYEAVESELGKRTVKKVKIMTANAVTVVINDPAEEEVPAGDPTDPNTDPATDPTTDPTNPSTDPTNP